MDTRLSFLTLGVGDLPRSRAFYEKGLGWTPRKVMENTVFYEAAPGFVFALYPRHLLAEDADISAEGSGFSGISLAINHASEAEVDATLAEAKSAGAKILKSAKRAFWGGYHGYFADPDGYAWEVAFNPDITIGDCGEIVWKD